MTKTVLLNPLRVVEIILAVGVIAFGLYVISPWYLMTETAAIANVFNNAPLRQLIALFYIIPGVLTLLGRGGKSLFSRQFGLFGIGFMWMYTTILRLATIGPRPFMWTLSLTLAAIAAYCWLFRKLDGDVIYEHKDRVRAAPESHPLHLRPPE